MLAIMLQTIPSFYAKISEQFLFISGKTYEKFINCVDYCIAHHDDKTCSLPTGKNHILLLGVIQELLYKLDTFCSTYPQVDCLYTLFKYRYSGKITAQRMEMRLTMCREQSLLTKETEEWTKCRILQKKALDRKI